MAGNFAKLPELLRSYKGPALTIAWAAGGLSRGRMASSYQDRNTTAAARTPKGPAFATPGEGFIIVGASVAARYQRSWK
jgi:hypothetical protein